MPRIKLKEVRERWRAESPDFFKKIQWLGGILTTIGGILITTPIGLPLTTAGGVMMIVGKLPVKGVTLEEANKLREDAEKAKEELNKLKTVLN